MDRLGVVRAVLSIRVEAPHRDVLQFVDKRPDRFALAAHVDPRRGMKAIRDLESLAKAQPVVVAQVIPCVVGLPPNDREYYPLYAKCIELGLPASVNTGIPGPPLPSKCQDPIHLDDVCLFFPELKLVMSNGADPWWAVAIRLMLKFPNLFLMTSANAPKYLPQELLQYMNTRGQDRVIFATDYPFLTLDRCLEEAQQLDLREGVLDKFLYANAERVFFSTREPR
jgi:predicted TIM-barrel fold metal-dependent hydrolase